jgi:hypothetical protein
VGWVESIIHKLGYYSRAGRRKPLLRSTTIKLRKIGLMRWWMDVLLFEALPFSLMSPNSHYDLTMEEYGYGHSRQEFDLKRLQPTVKHVSNGLDCNLE